MPSTSLLMQYAGPFRRRRIAVAFKRATLKDISKAVGLSVPVVSRIMNGRETYCSERKIRAVKETAAALGYRSNVGYRIMTGSGTNIVAVLF